ncbi:30S ribosomal protein S27ae [Candidatus Pacearchaeota archaeon]|nr:30S ribosomal protein S27ae [Candidatus Pacearchaeota archaeon]
MAVKERAGKKKHKNKPTSQKYKKYTIQNDTAKRGKQCLKCGFGIFMAEHKDRFTCGKCSYTEFLKK